MPEFAIHNLFRGKEVHASTHHSTRDSDHFILPDVGSNPFESKLGPVGGDQLSWRQEGTTDPLLIECATRQLTQFACLEYHY